MRILYLLFAVFLFVLQIAPGQSSRECWNRGGDCRPHGSCRPGSVIPVRCPYRTVCCRRR
uniref:Antimicrobial-peptide n=1 Tax=Alligator sinensis TaxID=38654 RepID=A0A2H4ZLD1_ALLSI|nr:antimicrobial-peptide [Alligator sinensis]